jgi:hypothetical protein
MRLLVRPSLITEALKREFRIVVNPISIPLLDACDIVATRPFKMGTFKTISG